MSDKSTLFDANVREASSQELRILFVEDSQFFVKVVNNFLNGEEAGSPFRVFVTGSFSEAKNLIRQTQFDVVLLDLTLPDASGLETFYQLHQEAPLIPIILLTNLDDETIALKAVASGAQDYLLKSEITKGLLVRSIRYAIERKKSELIISQQQQALVHSAKLRALGEMASGIAHEINNPISTIFWKAGHLVTLLENGRFDPNDFKTSASKIRATAERVSKIVASLRNLCRDGSADPFQKVRLQKLLDDTLEVCRERFTEQGVEVKVKNEAPGLVLFCRPTEVGQTLLNLLNNAFDAVQKNSERLIMLELMYAGSSFEISVLDNGVGLSDEAKKRIFHPFFSTKAPGQGVGLGLSLAKKMMESQGWTLSLDEASKMTRFTIRIPSGKYTVE